MKSQILNKGDKVLITQEFIDNLSKMNCFNKTIWRVGESATVYELSDYSTVRIYRGIWDVWVTNPIAENMREAYLYEVNTGFAWDSKEVIFKSSKHMSKLVK